MTQETENLPAPPLTVDHVVDYYNRYPGEKLVFYTRICVTEPISGYVLQITVPEGVSVKDFMAPTGYEYPVPLVATAEKGQLIIWKYNTPIAPGTTHEYETITEVLSTEEKEVWASRGVVLVTPEDDEEIIVSDKVSVSISGKGNYLKYLPSIYERDDFMGRFLMLFESFWKPVNDQIRQISYYFDPMFIPVEALPWLASWVDLVLDERWSEARRRKLLSAAVKLYRKRGTRQGMEEYLEIYTGEKPIIVEHRARNLRLGPESRLGPGIALGMSNEPHTFTVTLTMPTIDAADPEDRNRLSAERNQRIESIIDAEKPAHTAYRLEIVEVAQ